MMSEITNEERREVAQKLRDIERVDLGDGLVCLSCDLGEALDFDWANDDHIFDYSVKRLADLIDRPIREDFSDNEHSNVVDNLSLLINPVGACRLTAEQQLEALKDAIGCSEGQDWQDQTWVERLIELIDRPTCKNIYAETVTVRACENGFMCSKCGNVIEDCEGYYVNGTFNYCSKCGAEVIE